MAKKTNPSKGAKKKAKSKRVRVNDLTPKKTPTGGAVARTRLRSRLDITTTTMR